MLAAEEGRDDAYVIDTGGTDGEEAGGSGCTARAEAYRYVLRLLDDQQQDSVNVVLPATARPFARRHGRGAYG